MLSRRHAPSPGRRSRSSRRSPMTRRYLLRDRDSVYGAEFRRWVEGISIAEVLTAPRSPWQNPFAERVIGTIRRELLDHVIVLNEGYLLRRLRSYLRYCHGSRTHLALEKDAPEPRGVVAVVEPLSPRRRDRERPRLLHPGPCHGTHCLELRRGYIARSRPGLPSMGAHRGIRCSTTSDRVLANDRRAS